MKAIEDTLPELPDAKKQRLQSQYGLSAYDAGVLIIEADRADYFEAAAKGRDAKLVSNWVTNELLSKLSAGGHEIASSPLPPEDIAQLVELIETGVISSKIAKEVFEHMTGAISGKATRPSGWTTTDLFSSAAEGTVTSSSSPG